MEYYAVKLNDKGVIAVDDTILVKDSVSSAGAYMLEGFKCVKATEDLCKRCGFAQRFVR